MILVDTSVWVAVFRREQPLDLEAHADLEEVVTCLPVVQEVLQGFGNQSAYRIAREAMTAFPIVEDPMPRDVFIEAADLYRLARTQGVTVRSSVDCLIATCALRHDLSVLHTDRDFEALSKVSSLKQRRL